MKRYAEQSITLSDGVQIPKGTIPMVSMEKGNKKKQKKKRWDKSKYVQANEFQRDCFL